MDTLIFGLLLFTAWTILRGGSRAAVLWLFAVGLPDDPSRYEIFPG